MYDEKRWTYFKDEKLGQCMKTKSYMTLTQQWAEMT